MTDHPLEDDLQPIRVALSARPVEPVAVKPLDWEEIHQRRSDEDPHTEVIGFEANTAFDAWYNIEMRAADFVLHCVDADRTSTIHETERAAKAAAQADYEARIRSALIPAPPVQPQAERAIAGWSVRGAEAYSLFTDEDEAREFAGTWGLVRPVYEAPAQAERADLVEVAAKLDKTYWEKLRSVRDAALQKQER